MSTRLVLITALLMCASWADAEIPRTMSYQGVLKNNGIVVPDGSYNVTFRLYADTTQAALWTETQTLVTTGGVFSAVLGRILPLSLPFDQPYYLGIAVGGSPEMTPRLPLTSAPYSLSGGGAAGWTVSGNNLHSSVTGNVGIGTSAPVAKLDVSGNIHGVRSFSVWQAPDSVAGFAIGRGPGQYDWGWEINNYIGGVNRDLKLVRLINHVTSTIAIQVQQSTGNVGIGISNPQAKLDVDGEVNAKHFGLGAIYGHPGNGWLWSVRGDVGGVNDDLKLLRYWGDGYFGGIAMQVQNWTGNIGIGTENPQAKLDVGGDLHTSGVATLHQGMELGDNVSPGGDTYIDFHRPDMAQDFNYRISNIDDRMLVFVEEPYWATLTLRDHKVGINNTNPTTALDVAGTTRTGILQITGGADLAEPFPVEPMPAIDVLPGMLMVIDEQNPGALKICTAAYDTKVAGIISGAGGVNPGLTLSQHGKFDQGQNIALNGRVYALADASNGPIQPGDLLTTSNLPGHAMKATDRERTPGAVIGKAMSSLESGQGLVLVLVNLQ